MGRKRVAGRFVREDAENEAGIATGVGTTKVEATKGEAKKAAVGAPRPRYCRTFARARVAEALPEIVQKFAEEARKGSIPHMKMLAKIGGLDSGEVVPKATRRRGKSVVRLLLENLREARGELPTATEEERVALENADDSDGEA